MSVPSEAAGRRRHWQRTHRLTMVLLVLWFCITFVVAYFARALSFEFFGWPFSFWMAAQGALFVYLAIVAGYAWRLGRYDAEAGVHEEQEED